MAGGQADIVAMKRSSRVTRAMPSTCEEQLARAFGATLHASSSESEA